MKYLTIMNTIKYFVFALLLANNVAADYLECYVCEDCEENEGHFEYCPPLEDIQTTEQLRPEISQGTEIDSISPTEEAALDTTAQVYFYPDLTTAFTHFVTEKNSDDITPFHATTAEAATRPFSENITQTTNAVTDSNLTILNNFPSTIIGYESIEVLTTVWTWSQNTLEPNEGTNLGQSSTGTFITAASNYSNTEMAIAETVNISLASLHATEAPIIGEINIANITRNVTMTNLTGTLPVTSGVNKETTSEIEKTMSEMWTTNAGMATTALNGAYLTANITSMADIKTTMEMSQTIAAELQGTTVTLEASESIKLGLENSNFSTELELEPTTEASGGSITENIALSIEEISAGSMNSSWGYLFTEGPKELNTTLELVNTAMSEETTTSSMATYNPTTSHAAEPNLTDSFVSAATEVSNETTVVLQLSTDIVPISPTAFGATFNASQEIGFEIFGNVTTETAPTRESYTNSTSSQEISFNATQKFESATTTDGTDVSLVNIIASDGLNNASLLGVTAPQREPTKETNLGAINSTNSGGLSPNITGTLELTSAMNENLSNVLSTARPQYTLQIDLINGSTTLKEASSDAEVGEDTGFIEESNMDSLGANNSTNIEVVHLNSSLTLNLAGTVNTGLPNSTVTGDAYGTTQAVSSSAGLESTTLMNIEPTNESILGSLQAITTAAISEIKQVNATSELNFLATTNTTQIGNEMASLENATTAVSPTELLLTTTAAEYLDNTTVIGDSDEITQTEGDRKNTTTVEEPLYESTGDGTQIGSTKESIVNFLVGVSATVGENLSINEVGIGAPTDEAFINTTTTESPNATQQTELTSGNTTLMEVSKDFVGHINDSSVFNTFNETSDLGLAQTADLNAANIINFGQYAVPTSGIRTETILDTEKTNAKQSISKANNPKISVQELTEGGLQQKPQHRGSWKILQHKHSRNGNFASMRMGNVTYKCYSVRVKGKNKVQINKGCVAVRPQQNACALLADKYGTEALESCQLCLEGKCNRSHGNELRNAAKVGTLIMSIGWFISALMN